MRETSEAVSIRSEIARRVRKTSVAAVSRELDIPEDAIARLAGGAGVRRGTLALARERLAQGRDVARPTDAAPGCDGPTRAA